MHDTGSVALCGAEGSCVNPNCDCIIRLNSGMPITRYDARVLLDRIRGQVNEGMWGMPWHTEAMKAVVSCDKLGGVAHTL